LTVQFAKSEADGIVAGSKRSETDTELLVNGRSMGSLNRYVDRAAKVPQRIGMPIPGDALEARQNIIELVQKPESTTGRRSSCVVSNLVVELPR